MVNRDPSKRAEVRTSLLLATHKSGMVRKLADHLVNLKPTSCASRRYFGEESLLQGHHCLSQVFLSSICNCKFQSLQLRYRRTQTVPFSEHRKRALITMDDTAAVDR